MQIETNSLNSPLLVKLLSGILYYEDPLWRELINQKSLVQDYFSPLGLELVLHEGEGYAFLTQKEFEEGEEAIPRLVRRHPLSFEVSLLLVILREELERFDMKATEERSLFLRKEDIRELTEVYFKEKKDEVKLLKELDRYINQVEKLGFLRALTGESQNAYEVMRVLKAKVDPEFLEEFKRKLDEHILSV